MINKRSTLQIERAHVGDPFCLAEWQVEAVDAAKEQAGRQSIFNGRPQQATGVTREEGRGEKVRE